MGRIATGNGTPTIVNFEEVTSGVGTVNQTTNVLAVSSPLAWGGVVIRGRL